MRAAHRSSPQSPGDSVRKPLLRLLRVTHFSPGGLRGRGGMGRFLAYLLPVLQHRHPDLRCRVVDTYGPGPFALMPFWFAAALMQLIWQALWKQADLVHIHMAAFGSTARKLLIAVLAQRLGLLVLLHLHGAELAEFTDRLAPRYRRWLIGGLNRAEGLVVIGHYWQNYLIGTLGIPLEKVAVIPNGVPDPGWHRETRPMDAGNEPSPCQLLALGELGPRKGTPEILAALASPGVRERAWSAVLAGNGPVAHYQTEAQRLGLETRIRLPGWVDSEHAWRLLSQSDVLLLPSRLEGLPVAILEAMASGVAVITTPVGAIPDAITDGETGLLTPVGDATALSAAIIRLLDDQTLRTRLAAAARRRFEEQFTIERTADHLAKLYRRLAPATQETSEDEK